VALRFSKQTANTKTIRISDSSNGNDENRVLIQMQEATTSAVLKMHELFSGRTILRGKIHEFGANVISESKVSVSKVLEGLEQALQEQGLAVRQEGSKITMAGTKAMMANVTPDLWQIATQLTPTGTPTGNSQDDALPAGVVSFKNTDMDQVLAILSELVDRTLLQPRTLDSTFYLRTVTPFSKLEATYLFLATLALHQTSVLPVGGKFVLIVPSREADYFKRLLKQKMPSQELLQENSTPTQEMSLETSR